MKKRKITAVSKHSHSCKKSAWAIANTITKSFSQGASGVRSSTNLFECNFHGGAQIKGVGFGVTRDLYTRIRATAPKRNDMLHYYNSWTSCC